MDGSLEWERVPKRDRIIMHVDANCFYASVEMFRRPELRGCAMCVGGDVEARHGIVLAKSPEAKAMGVKTGEALWEARRKCPDIVVVPPDYADYTAFSHDMRELYYSYTDLVEPFGLDECWLDVTHVPALIPGAPELLAQEISERVKCELGITVSVGVSWNKPFAKLGSDTDPGDGVRVITDENYRRVVWHRPARDLINVGPATERKLLASGMRTIGDLALSDKDDIRHMLGVNGLKLRRMARGDDDSPVAAYDPDAGDVPRVPKGIGNGLTAPHDITCKRDAKALLFQLAESVAQRMRAQHVRGRVAHVSVRHADLSWMAHQSTLKQPTSITSEVMDAMWELLQEMEPLDETSPIRGLSVSMSGLVNAEVERQPDLFGEVERHESLERLDETVDGLRSRFGNGCVRRLSELADPALAGLDIQRDNVIHPYGYVTGGGR